MEAVVGVRLVDCDDVAELMPALSISRSRSRRARDAVDLEKEKVAEAASRLVQGLQIELGAMRARCETENMSTRHKIAALEAQLDARRAGLSEIGSRVTEYADRVSKIDISALAGEVSRVDARRSGHAHQYYVGDRWYTGGPNK